MPLHERSVKTDDVPAGIRAMIAATVLFAATSAIAKWQVALHPVGEVMFLRSAASMAICFAFILPFSGAAVFRTRIPIAHVGRGLSQSISQTFTVMALGLMPLAGAIAINFSAPLWSAAIAIIALKERPGVARSLVLATGFAGVTIVAAPGADSLQVGALYALANAVMYGAVTVAVRGMAKTESASTLLVWQMATVCFFHAFLLPFGVETLPFRDFAAIVASGVANAGAQYYWTCALALAPATAVSPFYYLTLVWALAIGFLAWDEVPGSSLIAGASIVAASAIVLLRHERRASAIAARSPQAAGLTAVGSRASAATIGSGLPK